MAGRTRKGVGVGKFALQDGAQGFGGKARRQRRDLVTSLSERCAQPKLAASGVRKAAKLAR
jgi:hypothetical protein